MSRNGQPDPQPPHDITPAVPAWIQSMRDAAQRVLKTEDVEAIVQAQVDAAKKGNQQAIKFVFEQILGGAAMKGATFVQNNNYGGDARGPGAGGGRREDPTPEDLRERLARLNTQVEDVRPPARREEPAPAFRSDGAGDPPFKPGASRRN